MHVLIEGGSHILGSAFDQRCVDHVAAFIAPKIVGGSTALSPVGGLGLAEMASAWHVDPHSTQQIGKNHRLKATLCIIKPYLTLFYKFHL